MTRVFISCALADEAIAQVIALKLGENDIDSVVDTVHWPLADSLTSVMKGNLASGDYVILLLSKHYMASRFTEYERDRFLMSALEEKGFGVLPIVLDDCVLPRALQNRVWFDLRPNRDEKITDLALHIEGIRNLDFKKLNVIDFEQLVVDLLVKRGFKDVELPRLGGQ